MKYIYQFIDDIPMYRAVLYALIGIVVTAFTLSAIGVLGFSVLEMTMCLAAILGSSLISNYLFALVFSAHPNKESALITGLIIFLLIFPNGSLTAVFFASLTAAIAQASKYILAVRGRHIFNPAAIGVTIASLLGLSAAVWWVGSPLLLPAVLILGGLTVLKVREVSEVLVYLLAAAASSVISSLIAGSDVGSGLSALFISGPLLFAATIMLTEPLTAPGQKYQKVLFALLVGLLTGSGLAWLSKPEVALLIGNLAAFLFGAMRLLRFKVVSVDTIAPGIIQVALQPRQSVSYVPGQYLELTVPHKKSDSRGSRRMFSIASAPGATSLDLVMNLPERASSYKRALSTLSAGSLLTAPRVAGSFVLPKDPSIPIVMIAGGIGITPFLSMIQSMLSVGSRRPVTLIYAVKSEQSFVYKDVLNQATTQLGVSVVPIVSQPSPSWQGQTGQITADFIRQTVTDTKDTLYYVSGPNRMVESIISSLSQVGIPRRRIRTDHFTGY